MAASNSDKSIADRLKRLEEQGNVGSAAPGKPELKAVAQRPSALARFLESRNRVFEKTSGQNGEFRETRVKATLVAVLVLNLVVALAKLVVGWVSASISMVADGFHSLTDSASNVVGLIGISVAARPPDEDHPYGHRKFETLAALLIGALLSLTLTKVHRT